MSSPQVSRRTLARGAAWTVPVVAIAVAAPAFAASPSYVPTLTLMAGCRCGVGGGPVKTNRIDVTFTNTSGDTFAVTNPDVIIIGVDAANELLQVTPAQTNTVPTGIKTLKYTFTRGNNPSSDTVTFKYTITNQTTSLSSEQTVTMDVTWGSCTDTCQD
jgi:hypothetical protein